METMRIGTYEILKQTAAEYEDELQVDLQKHLPDCKNVRCIYQVLQLGRSTWFRNRTIQVGASKELLLEFIDGTFGRTVKYGYTYCRVIPGSFLDCIKSMLDSIELF